MDHDRPLTSDGLSRQARENGSNGPLPYDHPVSEQQRAASTATARRLDREETTLRTAPVAGHDFAREARERDGRERGGR